MSSLSQDTLEHIINHVFLPPKLPHEEDTESEIELPKLILTALRELKRQHGQETPYAGLDAAITMLESICSINCTHGIDEPALQKRLKSITVGQTIAMKVTAQNAAILITRTTDNFVFECFELSAPNEVVMKTKGALRRSLPSKGISVATQTVNDTDFIQAISATIARMSTQAVEGSQRKSRKSGKEHDEDRDTVAPTIVSGLLFSILHGLGTPATTTAITKRVRDEVLWNDARRPWRRSPMWLLIRTALQLVLQRSGAGTNDLYKSIMAWIMSYMLDLAIDRGFSIETLFIMECKISRRLAKLTGSATDCNTLTRSGHTALSASHEQLKARWEEIQEKENSDLHIDLEALKSLNLAADSCLQLHDLDKHLSTHAQYHTGGATSGFEPSSRLVEFATGSWPSLSLGPGYSQAELSANLHRFELWVAEEVSAPSAPSSTEIPCQLMCTYHGLASSQYAANPEAYSVMLLTILSLFVLCDRAAVQECPLLREYNLDIPVNKLQNLLLPRRYQMEQLLLLEHYILSRKANLASSELFTMSGVNGFAIRYFDRSSEHQQKLEEITRAGQKAHDDKLEEFVRKKEEYLQLKSDADSRAHDMRTIVVDRWCDPVETEQVHCSKCTKCRLERQYKNMKIKIAEWPISQDKGTAKTTVFELMVPVGYAHWRECRSFLLQNVLGGTLPQGNPRTRYSLDSNDPYLNNVYRDVPGATRVGLLSEHKPASSTHYCEKYIADIDRGEQLCVPNGLHYRFYDNQASAFIGHVSFTTSTQLACTYKTSLKALQPYLFRPSTQPDGPSPNTVISGQSEVPEHVTLEEFKDLATIPLGHCIQWHNIALQLVTPTIDFKNANTTLVILQCIYQAGPPNGQISRASHDALTDGELAHQVLDGVSDAVQRLRANWDAATAFGLFAAIVARILTLRSDLKPTCLRILADLREVTFGWMLLLTDKADQASSDTDRLMFTAKVVYVALICAITFDLDDEHLAHTFVETANVSKLVQILIAIQEGGQGQNDALSKLMRQRFQRLMHRAAKSLSPSNDGLNAALKCVWASYEPGPWGWHECASSHGQWIFTETASSSGTQGRRIHLNLLDGQLLVDGIPLNQAPISYRQQSLWQPLFGTAAVKVMPASVTGFEFSTKRMFVGYSIQLGLAAAKDLSDSKELVVRATNNTEDLQLLPNRLFSGRVPKHFSEDYVYWHNLSTGTIIVCPITDPWHTSSSLCWTLSKRNDNTWQMRQNHRRMVGLSSSTSQMIGSVLKSLTRKEDMHIFFLPLMKEAQIEIPSRRLSFKLASGSAHLSSKDHASMYVDQDQSIGSLIGLKDKLVLRSKDGRRLALILDSSVSHRRLADHMTVSISNRHGDKVHAYVIDTLLGGLTNHGGLRPRLFLAYLHALTSSCLPDPLTSRTGTESALVILESAAAFSMQQLTDDDLNLLEQIAALSPKRRFYPEHLTQMQNVTWDEQLLTLSQHGWFFAKVQRLVDHYQRQQTLFRGASISLRQSRNMHLCGRDAVRTSSFTGPDFGAEDHTDQQDQKYVSRCVAESPSSIAAVVMAKQVRTRATTRWIRPAHSDTLWRTFVATPRLVYGMSSSVSLHELTYDANLLGGAGEEFVVSRFLALCSTFHKHRETREYTITIFLATLSYAGPKLNDMLQALVAFMHASGMQTLPRPTAETFRASLGIASSMVSITNVLTPFAYSRESSSHTAPTRGRNEKKADYDRRCDASWTSNSQSAMQSFAQSMHSQWPIGVPTQPAEVDRLCKYIMFDKAMVAMRTRFQEWNNNHSVWTYLGQLEELMTGVSQPNIAVLPTILAVVSSPPRVVRLVTKHSVLAGDPMMPPLAGPTLAKLVPLADTSHQLPSSDHQSLEDLVHVMEKQADSAYAHRYAEDLRSSLTALKARNDPSTKVDITFQQLSEYVARCKTHMDLCLATLSSSLNRSPDSETSIERMPRICMRFFLQQLNRHNWKQLSLQWKRAIVNLGLSITTFQQATRLLRLHSSPTSMMAELSNPGHVTWSPMERPEALLLEIESDILIRDVQAHVAACMLSPEGAINSTIQLNMGEGKTSVIVPLIAIDVANADQLALVVVGKPQSAQMADMLRTKIGGLIDRRLYFMPFSRSLDFGASEVTVVSNMIAECNRLGAVLILQPEHLLSFQHMAAENHLRDRHPVGKLLSSVQDYLDHHSRYIVDECDEVFSVRFELVYSVGHQHTIDGGSSRWSLIQEVLGLVRAQLPLIEHQLPDQIEVKAGVKGSFPRTRLLKETAADMLMHKLATHICDHGLDSLPIARQQQNVRDAIFAYITTRQITADAKDAVEQSTFWTASTKPHLLLLRGLLAGGILDFVLSSKRWRVQYGPTQRTPVTRLAVPYSAKDCPSLRSEFSHPDVVILLTSLSHYYEGLSDDDLFKSLELLSTTDEPDAEYALWTRDAYKLPQEFMQVQGINLKDRPQCVGRLFPALRYSKGAIDYFLNKLVFPKEMKEFPSKLSASGWDIGKTKHRLTTGFSGTNDSKHLLPLTVQHLSLAESEHTNALVLDYLLQSQNATYMLSKLDTADSTSLLATILRFEQPVQVILDVGAQIVEEDSKSFAVSWLKTSSQGKEAVVFVDDKDIISVADKRGHIEPLQNSPFASRLSACLVFLDEAHTRGIDLKLPIDYRAAVTLGARLTKDRLVQACMRMRQLGKGQTVVFCVPEEIQHKIRAVTSSTQIDVQDVLLWAMSETQSHIHSSVPLWAAQGQRYFKQAVLWEECKNDGKTTLTKQLAARFLEDESQTIEQRYLPHAGPRAMEINTSDHPGFLQIADRCHQFDNLDFDATGLEEEQERELAVEIESERQVQRPAKAKPLPHSLHPVIQRFALNGALTGSTSEKQKAFYKVFDSLTNLSAASSFPVAQLSARRSLLVSRDFANTVELGAGALADDFQRSVQWILTSRATDSNAVVQAIVISPYEANLLYKQMKQSQNSTMHVFKARFNISHPCLDDLKFCPISGHHERLITPRSLALELALFAGQVYLASFTDYKLMCAMLGLATDSSAHIVDADGFIRQDAEGRLGGTSGLSKSPVAFLQFLLSTVRRHGESIKRTHMGRVLSGRLLAKEDFDDQ